ncbi:MAG: hypothetical protein JO345_06380 [Streptosporangiaceae bacterium]|nr:hypothetical protein [Streptosporangiaceae bacterium]
MIEVHVRDADHLAAVSDLAHSTSCYAGLSLVWAAAIFAVCGRLAALRFTSGAGAG